MGNKKSARLEQRDFDGGFRLDLGILRNEIGGFVFAELSCRSGMIERAINEFASRHP